MDKKDKTIKNVSFKEQPEIIKSDVHHRNIENTNIENTEPVIKKDSVEILKEEQAKIQTNETNIIQDNKETEITGGEIKEVEQRNQFIEIVNSFSLIPSLQTIFFIILLIVCFFVFIYNKKIEHINPVNQTMQMQEV